jgi:hypothetical protein
MTLFIISTVLACFIYACILYIFRSHKDEEHCNNMIYKFNQSINNSEWNRQRTEQVDNMIGYFDEQRRQAARDMYDVFQKRKQTTKKYPKKLQPDHIEFLTKEEMTL